MQAGGPGQVQMHHASLGRYGWNVEAAADGPVPFLFTDNESNLRRLFQADNPSPYVKDAFHDRVVRGQQGAVNPKNTGTKVAAHRVLDLAPGETAVMRCRLYAETE